MTHVHVTRHETPLDSDEYPIAVFVQGDDIDATTCDTCHAPCNEWPRIASYHPCGRPGAMFQAALYCATCMPRSYDAESGIQVSTFWGDNSHED